MKFLLFYRKESFLFDDENFYTNFYTGLGHVWNQLKGEVIWQSWDDPAPPTTEGDLYVGCWYKQNVLNCFNWAKQYPKLNVYICGPIHLHYGLKIGKDLPNFHEFRGDAEDILFDGKTSEWNVDLPKIDGDIGYTVSLTKGKGCYWGKCIFCKITGEVKYRDINNIPIVDHHGHKYIWIHTFAMPGDYLNRFYPRFEDRDDITYMSYIRADQMSIDSYRKVIPNMKVDGKYIAWDLGIECPSNKMLKYMNKNMTKENFLDFIELATRSGNRVHFNLILNWKSTDWNDVKEIEGWLKNVNDITGPNTITANLYPLALVQEREIFKQYKPNEIRYNTQIEDLWTVKIGEPILTQKQLEIREAIRELYHNHPFRIIHDWIEDVSYNWMNGEKTYVDNLWEKP